MHVDGRPCGVVNLASIDTRNLNCEWAFYIGDARALKSGLGRIAEFHTLDYVSLSLGMEKLNCAVLDFNKAVVNMHLGFGFQQEGRPTSQIHRQDGRCDVVLLGLTKNQWITNRKTIHGQKIAPIGDFTFTYLDGTPTHPVPV